VLFHDRFCEQNGAKSFCEPAARALFAKRALTSGRQGGSLSSGGLRRPNLQYVVRGAPQGPLAVHLFQASKQELPEPSGLLHLPEDRFHNRFSFPVDNAALFREQFSANAVDEGKVIGNMDFWDARL